VSAANQITKHEMKLKETDFANFIKQPFQAVLLYGPDNGKNSDFAKQIVRALEIPPDGKITAAGDEFRDKYDWLYSEACTPSMFGDKKLVVITNPGGRDGDLLCKFCESPLSAPVVVIADDLDSKSGLRKFFEGHKTLAALPLYADDAKNIPAMARQKLGEFGIKEISPDAMRYISLHLGNDRYVAAGLLEKLGLYASGKGRVDLEDAAACLPDSGAANFDEFKFNLTAGNLPETLLALDRIIAEDGKNIAGMLRLLMMYFKDLLACVAGGRMPFIFWKYESLFGAARRIWRPADLELVLTRMNELETEMRGKIKMSSGADAARVLLFRDFATKLALKAQRLAGKK